MRHRFKNTLYTVEDLKYLNGRWQYVRNEDGTLFSGPYTRTNLVLIGGILMWTGCFPLQGILNTETA